MLVRIGESVERGQPLVRVFAPLGDVERVQAMIRRALVVDEQPVDGPSLICERIC
jgi:thymidine phosphorylase